MGGCDIMATFGMKRKMAVIAVLVLLGVRVVEIQNMADLVMYAASWITILHVCAGAFIFVRLGAASFLHYPLEVVGLICLFAMAWFFTNPAWWCFLLAILMAVALVKYVLLYHADARSAVRIYAREKILSESPAIPIMTVLAVLFHRADPDSPSTLYMSLFVLLITTAFAFWLVVVRDIYRNLLRRI
jgi:hypothetical protein